MTEDVGDLVLANNYWQNMLLSNGRSQQQGQLLPVHRRVMTSLEERGLLDRAIEFLPSDEEINERHAWLGEGLAFPGAVSVLLAWSKIALTDDLMATTIRRGHMALDAAGAGGLLPAGPASRVTATGWSITRCARRSWSRCLANDIVNHGGITFVHRVIEETGAIGEGDRAGLRRRQADLRPRRGLGGDQVSRSGGSHRPPRTLCTWSCAGCSTRSVRWVLTTRGGVLDASKLIDDVHPVVHGLTPMVPQLLRGSEQERLHQRAGEFVALGAPEPLAMRAAACLDQYSLLDIADIAKREKEDPETVAALYFAISERFGVDDLLTQISNLERADRWSALARAAVRQDLYAAQAGLDGPGPAAHGFRADPRAADRGVRAGEPRGSDTGQCHAQRDPGLGSAESGHRVGRTAGPAQRVPAGVVSCVSDT
jgi:glutamate dehydrogenase